MSVCQIIMAESFEVSVEELSKAMIGGMGEGTAVGVGDAVAFGAGVGDAMQVPAAHAVHPTLVKKADVPPQ